MAVTKVATPPRKVWERFTAWKKTTAPTEMFAASDYEKRIVGYMKVNVSQGTAKQGMVFARREVDAGYKPLWFPVRCDGYVMPGIGYLDNANVPVMDGYIIDATAVGEIAVPVEFGERTGLNIQLAHFNTVITFLRNSGLGYKEDSNQKGFQQIGTVNIPTAVPGGGIIDSINSDPLVAFFLVDTTPGTAGTDNANNVNIYVCKKDLKNKYIVDWKTSHLVPNTTDWNTLETPKPFCTTNLSDPALAITLYERSITKLQSAGVVATATPKKDPPPFNFFDIVKKLKDVKKIIENIASSQALTTTIDANRAEFNTSSDVKTRIDKNAKNLVFLEDLKAVGCVGVVGSDTHILGDENCKKIDNVKAQFQNEKFDHPVYKGGRRSKRNKHRRNKRTVSHRGRGHKRSRRVDGGSRKCGKKCRRKHTRK